MDTFERVRKWLAASLGLREETITPRSTLGDLFHQQTRITPDDEIRTPDTLIDNLSPDSLDVVELIIGLDDAFHLEISDTDIANLPPLLFDKNTTVQQIVDLIDKRAKE